MDNDNLANVVFAAAARAGDGTAFLHLTTLYRPQITSFIRHRINDPGRAAELTQETFDHAYDHLEQLRDDACFKSWLYMIARTRVLIDARSPHPTSLDQQHTPPSMPPLNLTAMLIQQTLKELHADHQQILVLRYVRGFTTRETAVLLNISLSAAQRRLSRARKAFRAHCPL